MVNRVGDVATVRPLSWTEVGQGAVSLLSFGVAILWVDAGGHVHFVDDKHGAVDLDLIRFPVWMGTNNAVLCAGACSPASRSRLWWLVGEAVGGTGCDFHWNQVRVPIEINPLPPPIFSLPRGVKSRWMTFNAALLCKPQPAATLGCAGV